MCLSGKRYEKSCQMQTPSTCLVFLTTQRLFYCTSSRVTTIEYVLCLTRLPLLSEYICTYTRIRRCVNMATDEKCTPSYMFCISPRFLHGNTVRNIVCHVGNIELCWLTCACVSSARTCLPVVLRRLISSFVEIVVGGKYRP